MVVIKEDFHVKSSVILGAGFIIFDNKIYLYGQKPFGRLKKSKRTFYPKKGAY
jgi:hypothetical protein